MPPSKRRQPLGVIARLLAEPHRYRFFQAVRLLDRWFARRDGTTGSGVLSNRLRFRNTLALGFPASEVAEVQVIAAPQAADDANAAAPDPLARVLDATLEPERTEPTDSVDRIDMTPAFMGLLGVNGALPLHYTELLAEREIYHRDTAARAFLDVFQHRAVSLFYQAWLKHRLPVQYESDRRRNYLPLVLAVAGIGQPALRDRLHPGKGGVADDTLAYFAGLLQHRPVSAGTVRQVVREYFQVPIEVEQFIGRWFTLPPESASTLGVANAVLGASAMMGERVWQRDLRMRLTLGPMGRTQFLRFLPGGTAALALRELLAMLTGVTLEYEVRLALRADAIEGVALTEAASGAQLGWDSFLVTRPQTSDRTDAGYDLHALA